MPTTPPPSPFSSPASAPAPSPVAIGADAPPPATASAPATTSRFWDSPGTAHVDGPAPAPPMSEQTRQSVPAVRHSRLRLAAAAVLLIAVTSGVTLAGRRFLTAPVVADGMGTLVVQTNPSGASVDVDGERRGVTPLSLDLPPGRHTLKLATEGSVRSMPVMITAGGQVSHFIELPRASAVLGELRVRTDPPGAQVTVDGHAYGQSPLTVEGLAPGVHTVVLQNEMGSFTQEVKIEAGTTASLVMPMTAPANAPVSGWIAVNAPAELQIYEDGQLLGTSQTDRIMVSIGRHRLQVVNESLGYSESHVVNVSPGRVTTLKPAWPMGSVSLNAIPWAEVWIDGRSVGETPLGNVAVPVGRHEVVFRHPDLGERRVESIVTSGAPAKVSVDLRQR